MKSNDLLIHFQRAIGWGKFGEKNQNIGQQQLINNKKRFEIDIE